MKSEPARFRTPDAKFGLLLEEIIMKEILKLCASAGNEETGGILVGRYSQDRCWAEVTGISGPPEDSRRSHSSFTRGVKGLQKWLQHVWSSNREYYVGEWHFHPFADASASPVDAAQLLEHSGNSSLRCPEPVMLIVGGDPRRLWQAKAYVNPKGGKLREMVRSGHPATSASRRRT